MTPYLRAANISDGELILDDIKTMDFTPSEQSRYALNTADVLVTEGSGSRAQVGQSAVWTGASTPMMFQNTVLRLRAHSHVDPRFLYWWSRYAHASGLYSLAAQGLAIWHLSAERVRALPFTSPGLTEQRQIADFLDDQVARLDRATELHAGLVSLRNDRIDSLAWGYLEDLEPATNELPSQVSLLPMKRLISKLSRPTTWSQGSIITAFRDGQVTARSDRRLEGYTDAANEQAQAQVVQIGELVIHGLDGFAGAIGTSEGNGVCSPAYHVCRVSGGDSDFYGRLLRLMAINGYLSLFGGSTRERAVDFRNWGTFSQIPIPAVPSMQQKTIGDMIRSLRPLAIKVAHMQELIQERKRALISAAVTGQFDVTTARVVA